MNDNCGWRVASALTLKIGDQFKVLEGDEDDGKLYSDEIFTVRSLTQVVDYKNVWEVGAGSEDFFFGEDDIFEENVLVRCAPVATEDNFKIINHHLNTIGWQTQSDEVDEAIGRLSPAQIVEGDVFLNPDLTTYLSAFHVTWFF